MDAPQKAKRIYTIMIRAVKLVAICAALPSQRVDSWM